MFKRDTRILRGTTEIAKKQIRINSVEMEYCKIYEYVNYKREKWKKKNKNIQYNDGHKYNYINNYSKCK